MSYFSRHAAVSTSIAALIVALSACSASGPSATPTGQSATIMGSGVVLIQSTTAGSKFSREGVAKGDPVPGMYLDVAAPIGTIFEYDGWQAEVTTAELTTQPNDSDSSNPVSVVLQMQLDVTAPNALEQQDVSPFRAEPTWKTLDMIPCSAPSLENRWDSGESRKVEFCHYFNVEEIGDASPEAVFTIWSGNDYVAEVFSVHTRGPDY